MANSLTGDFDVVAEFAIGAANRVIAAMHRVERFLHSTSVRVEDTSPPGHGHLDPSIVASVDLFGDPSADHERIPPRLPVGGFTPPSGPVFSLLDSIVNLDNLAGVDLEPLPPSKLQGRAQLQLSPPTIAVTDASGRKVTITMGLRARYFPDPQTPPVAEFVRGQLQITASVNQVASQVGNVVEIDIKGSDVTASFIRQFSSTPISAEDLAGVNKLLRNALRNSFLPSNATLPSNIAHVQFKTLRGALDALAVMLDMSGSAGNPATQTNVFLGGTDDFAIGAGVEFVQSEFEPTLEKIRNQEIAPVSFTINGLIHTWHITYTFTINSVTLELKNGSMELVIKGHAHTGSWTPDFNFTVKQVMTLRPVGSTAELELGDLSVDTDSWVIDRFKGTFTSRISGIRDRALAQSNAQATVRKALDAQEKLGGLLDSLLKPQRPSPGHQPRIYDLRYTSAEIRTSGIVLHGLLSLTGWPAPHVEFERIPTTPSTTGLHGGIHGALQQGATYSALKSWIPGGAIDRYEWSTVGQTQPFLVDENLFIYTELILPGLELATESTSPSVPSTPVVSDGTHPVHGFPGYVPLCLKVRGSRISASGPPALQSVSASVCGYSSFPVVGSYDLEAEGAVPMIALTQPGPNGMIEVGGHASARTSTGRGGTPNLIVHFAGEGSSANLESLTRALSESGRTDSQTAILAVLDADQLEKTKYTPGVVYAERDGGGWERVFGVESARTPTTLIVGPDREIRWRYQGEVDSRALAEALRKSLVKSGPIRLGLMRSSVRIGQPPPNFIFEHAPGREITLRKLADGPVTLVFWKSTSKPSIDAVRAQYQGRSDRDGRNPVVLAINDGESAESAKRAAAENKLSATIVTDPTRAISAAYGVNVWPTVVSIDEGGLVNGVRYGSITEDSLPSPKEQRSAE